jgi:uncharacterized protein YbjT (DUF2867 family)
MASVQRPILVTGATGRVGSELLRLLARDGVPLRALVRNRARAAWEDSDRIRTVTGDLADEAAMTAALEGCEKLFLATPDRPDQGERERRIIEIARRCGIEAIVKVSAYAAALEPPISYGVQHRIAERALEASGLRWTVLRPYMYMQNFLDFAPLIRSKGLIPAPFGRARVSMVDARDVAAVARGVLAGDAHHGRIYEVTGPAAIDFGEAAAVIAKRIRRRVRYVPVPRWLAGLAMRRDGVSAWDVGMRLALFKMIKAGGEAAVRNIVTEVGGSPPRDFARFVDDCADAFS